MRHYKTLCVWYGYMCHRNVRNILVNKLLQLPYLMSCLLFSNHFSCHCLPWPFWLKLLSDHFNELTYPSAPAIFPNNLMKCERKMQSKQMLPHKYIGRINFTMQKLLLTEYCRIILFALQFQWGKKFSFHLHSTFKCLSVGRPIGKLKREKQCKQWQRYQAIVWAEKPLTWNFKSQTWVQIQVNVQYLRLKCNAKLKQKSW